MVVFQPHTYSRTKTLMNEFVNVLKDYECLIYKTFGAREKYDKSGSSKTLCNNLGKTAKYFNKNQELNIYLQTKIKDDYAIIFLGAGNIYDVAKNVTHG